MNKNTVIHFSSIAFVSAMICWFIWPTVSEFESKSIQPIASAVSTITGILLGFIMASMSIIGAAPSNTLIRNTSLTGYLPQLVERLHYTMGALLVVCLIFLAVLFVPESKTLRLSEAGAEYRLGSVFVLVGMFVLIIAVYLFLWTWTKFKDFAKHM
ncbi:MAG: hypothetical protein C9356_12375 [Oleiphilus sp.]|nr:MAG: hypothetical protein C9356_12375 [Oleiphilus sp.]